MSKLKIITLMVGCLIMVALIGYYSYTAIFPSTPEQDKIAEENKERAEQRQTVYKEIEEGNIEESFPLDMSEKAVMDAIHAMSHQKIKSEDGKKWSHLQITPERINRLIEIVEHNKEEYQHANLYLDILYSWKEGNFNSAVSDHNKIWKLKDGNVGKATRLLSDEEEELYIKQYFE